MRVLSVLASLIVALTADPALAQRYWGPDQVPYCSQAANVKACQAESLATLTDKLDLPTAEALAEQGYTGVRVFRYDAFGTIWPTVSFMSRPVNQSGREGFVEARTIHGDGHTAVLSREAWESGWREVDFIVDEVLNRPPPEPKSGPEPIVPSGSVDGSGQIVRPMAPLCLDPPVTIVEVVKDGKATRWWPQACIPGAVAVTAYGVANIVAAAFPTCAHFSVEHYGRGIGRLRVCLQVDGTTPLAAVEVMEILRPNIGGDTRIAYAPERQAPDVRMLTIAGQEVTGREAVVSAMKGSALGRRWLRILRARGDGETVTVSGQLRTTNQNAPDPVAVELKWRKSDDGEWRIIDWSVEQRSGG